jgi:hypothetical protein
MPMRNLCSRDRFDWRPGERIDGRARSRAQAEADLQSARQASRVARAWLAHVEREPRPPPGIVDRRLLAAKLALADLSEQERRAAAAARAMGAL